MMDSSPPCIPILSLHRSIHTAALPFPTLIPHSSSTHACIHASIHPTLHPPASHPSIHPSSHLHSLIGRDRQDNRDDAADVSVVVDRHNHAAGPGWTVRATGVRHPRAGDGITARRAHLLHRQGTGHIFIFTASITGIDARSNQSLTLIGPPRDRLNASIYAVMHCSCRCFPSRRALKGGTSPQQRQPC